MTQSTHHQKYKETVDAYKATQHRSTFAIKKELVPGIAEVVAASGANSLSDLIACMATHPEEAGALIKPIVERATIANKPTRTQTVKPLVKELASEATPEELQMFLEQIRSRKTQEV